MSEAAPPTCLYCPAHLSICIYPLYIVDQCSPATLPTVYNLYLEAALIGESYYTVIYLFFRSLVDSTCISFDNFLLLHT